MLRRTFPPVSVTRTRWRWSSAMYRRVPFTARPFGCDSVPGGRMTDACVPCTVKRWMRLLPESATYRRPFAVARPPPAPASLPRPPPKRNWPGAAARASPSCSSSDAAGMEAVDPVAPVGDDERAVVGDRERADGAQLAGPPTGRAHRAQELALRREDLHDVRALVADVDVAVGADRDRLREAEHAADALWPTCDAAAYTHAAGRPGTAPARAGRREQQRSRTQRGTRDDRRDRRDDASRGRADVGGHQADKNTPSRLPMRDGERRMMAPAPDGAG